MPRVSVVVPTYNQEQFIQSTLTSVLNQTYQDFEIVIANDASTDNTVTKIQAVHDPRIRLFSLERNQGESAATNYGIQQAQGKYIAILHSDDLFRPDKLERQVNFLEQNPQFDAVLSHAEVIDEAGRPLPDKTHVLQQIFPQPNRTRFQWLNQFFIRDNCLCQTSSMVRCSCYQTVGLYDRRLRQIPDFDFWVRFCLQHELHIIPEPLTQYRVHQSNISGIRPETIKRHHIEVLQILKHFLCEEVYQHIFEIFPYLYQQYGSGFESDLAPFLLAQQAFIVNRSPHQLFGLEILYQLLNQPDVVERLNQKYNFDFYDLIELTGKYDIFGFDQQSRLKANSTHISRGSLSTGNRSEKRLKLANLPGKIGQNPPLVSIVIPTYNGEQFISETLQTALQQTYTNLEIIVSDDGSVDQTLDIVHSFQQQCNWPCSVLTHKNYGLVGNLNFCIQQARGKYIKFLFQDDLLEPDCIAEMVALAEEDAEIGLVFSQRQAFIHSDSLQNPVCQAAYRGAQTPHQDWTVLQRIQSGQALLADPRFLLGRLNKIGEPTTVLIPKAVLHYLDGFDPELHQLLDVDLWFRIIGNYKIGFIDRPLSKLRIHGKQQTQKNISRQENLKDYQRLYQKMLAAEEYNFLSQELKQLAFGRLLAKSPDWAEITRQTVTQYQQNPQDSLILENIRHLRITLAKKVLQLPIEQLEAAYRGDLGRTHQILCQSGLYLIPLTEIESQSVNQLAQELVAGLSSESDLPKLMALMLYRLPHEVNLNYQSIVVPQYFLESFLNHLFNSIYLFSDQSSIEQSLQYNQALLQHLQVHFKAYSTSKLWNYAVSIFTQVYDGNLWRVSHSPKQLHQLLSCRTQIVEQSLQRQGHSLGRVQDPQPTEGSSIHLGILLDGLKDCWDTSSILPLLEFLDRNQFQIKLYAAGESPDSLKSRSNVLVNYCRQRSHLIPLSGSISQQVERIRQDNLDVLMIVPELTGRADLVYSLALHRLARLQIAAATHQMPPGLRQIDYYCVGEPVIQPQELSLHPQPLVLPGAGLCWSELANSPSATVKPTRASWGAATDTVIYGMIAPLNAISPDIQQIWLAILRAVPNSILVFLPLMTDYHQSLLTPFFSRMRQRMMQETGPINPQRFVMIKPLQRPADFRACLQLINIYLAPFPDSRPGAVAMALRLAIPTVVQSSTTQHSRLGAALLQELNISEGITDSTQSYVQRAVELGTVPSAHQRYRQKIQQQLQHLPCFVNPATYAHQFALRLKHLTKPDKTSDKT